jgi:hypothetical protein
MVADEGFDWRGGLMNEPYRLGALLFVALPQAFGLR